jgi:heme oxygenase (biliverdin-IX-beta and delta-forming)
VLGAFAPIEREGADDARIRRRFLARHPKSELYAGFGDFGFWRMGVVSAHLNGGFARAADLAAADVLTDVSDAGALIEAEEGAIAHMNADHAEACRLYASKLLGATDGNWACVGVDPDGIELQQNQTVLRLPFPQRVTGPGPLRAMLRQLADEARAK